MCYYVLSDIHGNLEALQAVLDDISKDKKGEYLSAGDIVVYGADPKACIKIVKSLSPKVLIAGNHDWGAIGLADIEYFNEYAKEAVIWTKGVLIKNESNYLKSFSLVHIDKTFTVVHGSLNSPENFYYILNSVEAYFTFNLMKTSLCFIGHSHIPGTFCLDGNRVDYTTKTKIKIENSKKYIVNAGSIGQPRDGDPRASYAIYDEDKGEVEIKRVVYDVGRAQKKILGAGLPKLLASRLSEGR